MGKVTVNGVNLHYQQKGEGDDIILVHGITSCIAQWYLKIFPELSKSYRVTIYDLRGHGLSEVTQHGYDSETMALDLLGLMDHLGIERAHLVGHSFGGGISLHLALLRPERVRRVVLLDTGLACLRHLRLIENWPGWKKYGTVLKAFGITLDRFLEVDRNQDVREIVRKSLSIPLQSGFRRGKVALTPRLKKLVDDTDMCSEFREVGALTEEALATIQTPVYAVYGATSPYEKMAEHLGNLMPNCRFELIEEAGHFYAIEEPQLALPRIQSFFEEETADVPAPAAEQVSS
ncbi:MAG: alpha/beta fold hydrolase [Acidobacteria bacterium]|nr:alpha/beta fold hydrolase [Acidobacteriota bacterium]